MWFSLVQSLSHVRLFVNAWTAARQASLSIANSWSLLKLMSIESVMPSNHLILSRSLLPPSILPSIRVFSNESVLCIRWPKYWRFSISPSDEYSGLISFRMGLVGSPCCPRDPQESSPTPQFKSISSSELSFLYGSTLTFVHGYWEDHAAAAKSLQSCPTLCDPMNHSTPSLPVHHQLLEFTQTHAHRVGDAIQPSHPLSSPSPPAPNPSQHQSLFQ